MNIAGEQKLAEGAGSLGELGDGLKSGDQPVKRSDGRRGSDDGRFESGVGCACRCEETGGSVGFGSDHGASERDGI